ncbi:MAG: TrkA family potassium uptake protein [Erysipelotrichaceae bacterium]|nr:TrkA family potassium uptake protein [Erysipelotrichaceae bacterium]MDY6034263.1 TrkA family potassium uptake protein [Bulleidia sp.]
MKQILIVGMGRFGRHIARKLNELNIQVLGIDTDEDKVREVLPYVTNAEVGDATNQEFLKTLGIKNFDVCIVAVGDNFLASLEITSYLKELGAKKVVSRAARDTQEKFLLRNGADAVVYPEKLMGNLTAMRYSSENIFDYIQIGKDFAVFEIAVPQEWLGKTIGQADVRKHYSINIIAIKKNDEVSVTPGASHILTADESLLVIGRDRDIRNAFHILG